MLGTATCACTQRWRCCPAAPRPSSSAQRAPASSSRGSCGLRRRRRRRPRRRPACWTAARRRCCEVSPRCLSATCCKWQIAFRLWPTGCAGGPLSGHVCLSRQRDVQARLSSPQRCLLTALALPADLQPRRRVCRPALLSGRRARPCRPVQPQHRLPVRNPVQPVAGASLPGLCPCACCWGGRSSSILSMRRAAVHPCVLLDRPPTIYPEAMPLLVQDCHEKAVFDAVMKWAGYGCDVADLSSACHPMQVRCCLAATRRLSSAACLQRCTCRCGFFSAVAWPSPTQCLPPFPLPSSGPPSLPAWPPAWPPGHLPAHLPACLRTQPACLATCLATCLPAHLPTCLPTCPPACRTWTSCCRASASR